MKAKAVAAPPKVRSATRVWKSAVRPESRSTSALAAIPARNARPMPKRCATKAEAAAPKM